MKHLIILYKIKYLIGVILIILPISLRAQCIGSWSASGTLNYLCVNGAFLQYNLGPNICPSTTQNTFNFTSPVQSVKLIFSAFGSTGFTGNSRMSVYLNNSLIDLNLACRITIGCQIPTGAYSINNGCLVDIVSGADGGISGFIYLEAGAFGLPAITSIGVAVSEPASSGTIFELDSCNLIECTTDLNDLKSDEIGIYPNPFSDKINISVGSFELCEIYVSDITSRNIFHQSFESAISVNTEQLTKGIYYYEVRNKKGVIKKGKIVKNW